MSDQLPIINCHTHIFTGKHVPPFLAKTFVPTPFYFLIPLPLFLWIAKTWRDIGDLKHKKWYRSIEKLSYKVWSFLSRTWLLNILRTLVGIWIFLHVLYILYDWFSAVSSPTESWISKGLEWVRELFAQWNILIEIQSVGIQIGLILFLLLFIPWGRNVIFWLFKKVFGLLSILPGSLTKDLINRYRLLTQFSLYKNQSGILSRLTQQYPPDTHFVVLAMDMKYMQAGKVRNGNGYADQLKDLQKIKLQSSEKIHPLIFIDPRRLSKDPSFFKFSVENGRVQLQECTVKKLIEEQKFAGFKIYPALGYYPFDEKLLPLWKYAHDHNLPIMSHCIKGTIYYRGMKKKDWNFHPVFEQILDSAAEPLLLSQRKNRHFTLNFTHPMNFLCLLEEPLLRKLVSKVDDKEIKQLFGYEEKSKPLIQDLRDLKVCLAHFGGSDQWMRFLEKDRYSLSNHVFKYKKGLDFFKSSNSSDEPRHGKIEQIWKYVDWYSIIVSMMLQYPNVYADISYILHKPQILPLLKRTLSQEAGQVRNRVLFGTDFYVVRNHKSDKELLTEMMAGLSEEEFDLIARHNPRTYLNLND